METSCCFDSLSSHRICSPTKLSEELQFLKKIASWNGFPKQVVSSRMKRFRQHHPTDNQDNNNGTGTTTNVPTLWLEMPYIGTTWTETETLTLF